MKRLFMLSTALALSTILPAQAADVVEERQPVETTADVYPNITGSLELGSKPIDTIDLN